jgi:two-component system response regulator RegA
LIVEDDRAFRTRLGLSMERRGFTVFTAEGIEEGAISARANKPNYAVVDMRLEDGNGLDLVPDLQEMNPDMRIIILTGYGNIASAVAAVKAGAVDYLAKPAGPEEIEVALMTLEGQSPPPPDNPMSADRVKWEHIQRIYELCDRNVSETARRLNMHRRTLQRILSKRSPQ